MKNLLIACMMMLTVSACGGVDKFDESVCRGLFIEFLEKNIKCNKNAVCEREASIFFRRRSEALMGNAGADRCADLANKQLGQD